MDDQPARDSRFFVQFELSINKQRMLAIFRERQFKAGKFHSHYFVKKFVKHPVTDRVQTSKNTRTPAIALVRKREMLWAVMTLKKIRKLFLKNLRKQPVLELPEFHPQTILRDLGDGDAFRLSDAYTGIFVTGATGSGKTSGPAKFFAYAFLAAGFAGLVLTAKKEERAQWEKWATDCGRAEDLVIVNADGDWRFNFLRWEAERSGPGGGFTMNVVNLLVTIAGAIAGGGGGPDAEGGNNGSEKFWMDALQHLCTNLVDLPVLAGIEVTLPLLRSIVNSAPLSAAQAADPKWEAESDCAAILRAADEATAKSEDAEARADYEECAAYWKKDFPQLSEKTRSIIVMMLSMLIRPLITRPLRKLFSSDSNITPEDAFEGKIILVDLPVAEYQLAGKIANHIWKFCFQLAVMRRVQPKDGFLRPCFLYSDEFQTFVTSHDAVYQSVCRSAGGCSLYLTQSRENLRRVLKNDDAVDALLNNLQLKVFCQNTGATNKWASEIMGERWQKISSTNVGQSRNEAMLPQEQQINHNAGVSRSEQRRFYVEPALFTTLKRGGALNGCRVEAVMFNGGQQFSNGRELLPYKFLVFNQT
jgi:hypothetical protein